MADAMLRVEQQESKEAKAVAANPKESKGKAKKVMAPPTVPLSSKETESRQKAVTPGPSPTPSSPIDFNAEAIAILRQMNTNQNKTNEKVEQLSQRVDEIYNMSEQCDDYCDDYEYENCDPSMMYGEQEEDISSLSGMSGTSQQKRQVEESESDGVFASYLKKFKKTDSVEEEINPQLASIVNNAFREGMPDDVFSELSKNINRPANCDSLKETRVNQGVWNVLKPNTQTEDSKLRGIQNAIVKATINVSKMVDAGANQFTQKMLDWGTDAIVILGQANKWLNIRRKDLHKRDMDPKLHYLCSAALQSTDQLYGDTIVKDIKDAQEFNKISRQVGLRGRGRGRGRVFRGRFRGNYNRRRGSSYGSQTSSTQPKTAVSSSKNSKTEHKRM